MGKMKMHYPRWLTQAVPTNLDGEAHRDRLIDAISLTAEVCGQVLSAPAAEMLADDLSHLDATVILAALARCRRELDGPLRIVEVLSRIDDGRPDGVEAWSMLPTDEHESIVWTEEMAHAWGIALPFLAAGDAAFGQSAFLQAYEKSVLEARLRHDPPRWTPSLGLDLDGRELALREAVAKGRATVAQAELLLGYALGMPASNDGFSQEEFKSLH